MALETISEVELLSGRTRRGDRPRSPRVHSAYSNRPEPAFGPLSELVLDLLERALSLTPEKIESLAASAGRNCGAPRYAEALLAMRHAEDRSGRTAASGKAASEAERIVVRMAGNRRSPSVPGPVEWTVVGQQAAWAAADAARALVVSDLLSESELRALTGAWDAVN